MATLTASQKVSCTGVGSEQYGITTTEDAIVNVWPDGRQDISCPSVRIDATDVSRTYVCARFGRAQGMDDSTYLSRCPTCTYAKNNGGARERDGKLAALAQEK